MIDQAVQAAIAAGKAILDVYAQDFEVEFKSDESPLTAADKAAHHIIVDALEPTGYPVLSEESGKITYDERRRWTTYWLVDPLDGTKEFIKKNGEFTVNIALIVDGKPAMGVVYVPVLDVLYCGTLNAEEGMPAWKTVGCSGKSLEEIRQTATPLCVSSYQPSSEQRPLRVVASKSHCNDETRAFIAELETKYGPAERVSRGSSLKLCMVAEGSADIYPRIAPTMEWDTAAAHAVVIAAGGAVFEYNPAVVADLYHAGMLDAVRDGSEDKCTSHVPPSTSALCALHYNKANLLNPYFVVSGLHE